MDRHQQPGGGRRGGKCWQLPRPSHVSTPLQMSPSSHEVPKGCPWQMFSGSQPDGGVGGGECAQRPEPSQVSVPLHALASSHEVPTDAGPLETHEPLPSQASEPLQTSPSSQGLPAGCAEQ